MQGSVALAGAAVLAMAGGTEAFAPVFGQGRTPAAAHSSAKGLSSCRQAPGRVITPLAGLRMVATDPTTDLKVCIFLLECNPAHDKYIEALLSILCHGACTGFQFANSVCGQAASMFMCLVCAGSIRMDGPWAAVGAPEPQAETSRAPPLHESGREPGQKQARVH
jgi:hypothetical protein